MSELKPEISSGRKFNAVWIIPLIALAIGVYMVVHTKLTEGPRITITFTTAEGLEAGKTKVEFRNVYIGIVEEVTLSTGLNSVVVTVKLDREADAMLRADTRFWVVRARVGAGNISGLGTLLSGAYIHLDPGSGARGKREFTGLDVPPLTPADAPGVRLVLFSENTGSVSAGDSILYNGFKVGRIEGVTFDSDKKEVRYDAFVDAPYDDLVTTSSRFWNVSGISISASTDGIRVSTGSLDTIILGGVAFGALPGLPAGEKAASGASYRLASSLQELQEDPYQHGIYYVTQFSQSLRGLAPGAPVEYRGIQIGQVKRILLKGLASGHLDVGGKAIPVLIYLEPGRLGVEDSAATAAILRDGVDRGVAQGLRATLQTGNLITGKLFVNIDFYPDAEPVAMGKYAEYAVIPSIPSGLGRLEQQVSTLLEKFNALPLENSVERLNTVMDSLDTALAELTRTMASLQGILSEESTRQLPLELNQTLAEMRKILAGLSPDSAAGSALNNSILGLNATLRNLQDLTRTLSNQPSAIVFPSDTPADPIPEAHPQ